jgi:hypothetical protein
MTWWSCPGFDLSAVPQARRQDRSAYGANRTHQLAGFEPATSVSVTRLLEYKDH